MGEVGDEQVPPAPNLIAAEWLAIKQQFEQAKLDMLNQANKAGKNLFNTAFANDENSRLWIGDDNKLHGMQLITDDGDRSKPFGAVVYENNAFSGVLYYPVKDDTGKVVKYEKTFITDKGIDGLVKVSDTTFVQFKAGKFEAASYKDGDMSATINKDGTFTLKNSNNEQIIIKFVGDKSLEAFDGAKNRFYVSKDKVEVNLINLAEVKIAFPANGGATFSSKLRVGSRGSIALGYSPTTGMAATADLVFKNGSTFAFQYAEQPNNASKLTFQIGYSWEGKDKPWRTTPPPQGSFDLNVDVDNTRKRASVGIGFQFQIRW